MPEIRAFYEPLKFKGRKLVLVTISGPADQPYFTIKDINNSRKRLVSKNAVFMKKDSYQVLPGRADFDRIYRKKYGAGSLEGKLELNFQNGSSEIHIDCIRDIRLPSDVQKEEIEKRDTIQGTIRGPDFLRYVEDAQLNDPASYKAKALPVNLPNPQEFVLFFRFK